MQKNINFSTVEAIKKIVNPKAQNSQEYPIFDGPGVDTAKQENALESIQKHQNKVSLEISNNYQLLGLADYEYQSLRLGFSDYLFVVKRGSAPINYYALVKRAIEQSQEKQRITTDFLDHAGLDYCVIASSRFATPSIWKSNSETEFSISETLEQNTYLLNHGHTILEAPNEQEQDIMHVSPMQDTLPQTNDKSQLHVPKPIAKFTHNIETTLRFPSEFEGIYKQAESIESTKGGLQIQFLNINGELDYNITPENPLQIVLPAKLNQLISKLRDAFESASNIQKFSLVLRINKILQDVSIDYDIKDQAVMGVEFDDSNQNRLNISANYYPVHSTLYLQNKAVYDAVLYYFKTKSFSELQRIWPKNYKSQIKVFLAEQIKASGATDFEAATVNQFIQKITAVAKIESGISDENKFFKKVPLSSDLYYKIGMQNSTQEFLDFIQKYPADVNQYVYVLWFAQNNSSEANFLEVVSYLISQVENQRNANNIQLIISALGTLQYAPSLQNEVQSILNQSIFYSASDCNLIDKITRFESLYPLNNKTIEWFCSFHNVDRNFVLTQVDPTKLDIKDCLGYIVNKTQPSLEFAQKLRPVLEDLSKNGQLLDMRIFKFVFESLKISNLNYSDAALDEISKFIQPNTQIVNYLLEQKVDLYKVYQVFPQFVANYFAISESALTNPYIYTDFEFFKLVTDKLISSNSKNQEAELVKMVKSLDLSKLTIDHVRVLSNKCNFYSTQFDSVVKRQLGLDSDSSNNQIDTEEASIKLDQDGNLVVFNLPSYLQVDQDKLIEIQEKLKTVIDLNEEWFAFVETFEKEILQICVSIKPLTKWQKAQSAIYKAAKVLNPANIVSKTVNTLAQHTQNNKFRYLGAAGVTLALGAAYMLTRDNGMVEGIDLGVNLPDPVSVLPDTAVDTVTMVSDSLTQNVYQNFSNVTQIHGFVDVQLPTGVDVSDLVSQLFDVINGQVQVESEYLDNLHQKNSFTTITNGGDVIVRNADGTFRELFTGVKEYALELPNGTQVESTGNYELMQVDIDGQPKAILYREVVLPNGQTGFVSGVNLK